MKFLSEMMSKRKPAETAETALDAPLDADGGTADDFPLPDFASVAGESLSPAAEAEPEAQVPEARKSRFAAEDDNYDWDITGLDLSDGDDNPIETEARDEGVAQDSADQGDEMRLEGDMMDKFETENDAPAAESNDDAKARAAQALASFAADLSAAPPKKMIWDDEDEGEPEAPASLDDFDLSAETDDTDAAADEADDPAIAAALNRLPDPAEDMAEDELVAEDDMAEVDVSGEDMAYDDMADAEMADPMDGMPAPQKSVADGADPWGEASKATGANLMSRSVQEKMAAMRAQAMRAAAEPVASDDDDDADDAAEEPMGMDFVSPSRPGFGSDGIAGQADDEAAEITSLSPLAALRAQREAALAASRAAEPDPAPEPEMMAEPELMPEPELMADPEMLTEEDAVEMDAEPEVTVSEEDLDTWAPEPSRPAMTEEPAPRAMPVQPVDAPMASDEVPPVRPSLRSAAPAPAPAAAQAKPPAAAEDDLAELAPSPRRAGRVKTRLLGFHKAEGSDDPIRAAQEVNAAEPTFPVGWLLVVKGPGRGTCFNLSAGASKIGRGEDQAVRLDFGDTSISRDNHAVVAYDDEQKQFFIGHGGKANLVRLNDMPVLSTETLNDGDVIRIGETVLLFVALCSDAFSWTDGPFSESTHAAE